MSLACPCSGDLEKGWNHLICGKKCLTAAATQGVALVDFALAELLCMDKRTIVERLIGIRCHALDRPDGPAARRGAGVTR
jgi:hypothetical protein